MGAPTHVVGFCFSGGLEEVVLIHKARPDRQARKMNGVGGKIEEGEAPLDAMIREFREETGCADSIDWKEFCRYDCPAHGTRLVIFAARSWDAFWSVRTTDPTEPIERVRVDFLRSCQDVIPNLRWLVPMALNALDGGDRFDVREDQRVI